eukprot:6479097-Amphidinium_carterae.1
MEVWCYTVREEKIRLKTCTEGYSEDLWHRAIVAYKNQKGPRLQLSRWGSCIDVCEHWIPLYSVYLCELTWLGLEQGWLKPKSSGLLQLASKKSASSTDASEPSEKESNQKLKHKCQNQLHLSSLLLMDRRHRLLSVMFPLLAIPLRRWHQEQVRMNSSTRGVAEFNLQM